MDSEEGIGITVDEEELLKVVEDWPEEISDLGLIVIIALKGVADKVLTFEGARNWVTNSANRLEDLRELHPGFYNRENE